MADDDSDDDVKGEEDEDPIIVCEPTQSTCTAACHKSHFILTSYCYVEATFPSTEPRRTLSASLRSVLFNSTWHPAKHQNADYIPNLLASKSCNAHVHPCIDRRAHSYTAQLLDDEWST